MFAAVQTHTVHGKVIGSVLGHETHVIQSLHKLLHHQHIALKIQDTQAIESASVTFLFHRKKARLPQDEIQALLGKVSAQGMPVAVTMFIAPFADLKCHLLYLPKPVLCALRGHLLDWHLECLS